MGISWAIKTLWAGPPPAERGRLWRVRAGWDVVDLLWCRGIAGPFWRAVHTARYLSHRGDTTSPWWCPAVGEAVTDCFGRDAIVVSVDVWRDATVLDYGAREPHRVRTHSWRNCVSPRQWADPFAQHSPTTHNGPVHIARPDAQEDSP